MPQGYITRENEHRLPKAWKPLAEHPRLEPGTWVPTKPRSRTRVVYCTACGCFWHVAFDPKDLYYSMHRLQADFEPALDRRSPLSAIWPLLERTGSIEKELLAGYFRCSAYDAQEAVDGILTHLSRPERKADEVPWLLDLLGEILSGTNPHHRRERRPEHRPLRLHDASVLLEIMERASLYAGLHDPERFRLRILQGLERLVEKAGLEGRRRPVELDEPTRDRLVGVAGLDARLERALHRLQEATGEMRGGRERPTARLVTGPVAVLAETLEEVVHLRSLKSGAISGSVRTALEEAASAMAELSGRDPVFFHRAGEVAAAYRRVLGESPSDSRREIDRAGPVESASVDEPAPPEGSGLGGVIALAFLIAAGTGIAAAEGLILGVFAIPGAEEFAALLSLPVLFFAVCVSLGLAGSRAVPLRYGFALFVGVGTVWFGHWLAYEWDGKDWARHHYRQTSSEALDEKDAGELRTRFIREILGEPDAGGMWDLLRLRARVGAEVPVELRARSGRLRDPVRSGAWMWLGWLLQAVLVIGTCLAAARAAVNG